MLWIAGKQVEPSQLIEEWGLNEVQQEVVQIMADSQETFEYPTADLLRFELKLRDHLVRSAIALYRSGLVFSTFNNARSNERYWERTELGGFRLRDGVRPSTGILDIFRNGRMYATECATAMVIILYHAVLQSINRDDFDRLFDGMILYDWRYDKDLDLRTLPTNTFLPGDIVYFANPDFDPDTPQWQGENAVYLGHGQYYGHGADIRTADSLIRFLNDNRRPDATRSAYLVHQATRPGFASLAAHEDRQQNFSSERIREAAATITAQIGSLYWEW